MLPKHQTSALADDMLRAVFDQHWQHARHVENERLAITGAYVALLTAALTYFSTKKLDIDALPLLVFLAFVSLVGLALCMKLYIVFHAHTAGAEAILKRSGVPSMLPWVDRYPLSHHRWLGVGSLFAALYQLGFALFVYLMGIALGANWIISVSLAASTFILLLIWSHNATRRRDEA